MKIILAVNAGSSSVKISVYSAADLNASPKQIADAQVSGLTAPPADLTYIRGDTTVCKRTTIIAANGRPMAITAYTIRMT